MNNKEDLNINYIDEDSDEDIFSCTPKEAIQKENEKKRNFKETVNEVERNYNSNEKNLKKKKVTKNSSLSTFLNKIISPTLENNNDNNMTLLNETNLETLNLSSEGDHDNGTNMGNSTGDDNNNNEDDENNNNESGVKIRHKKNFSSVKNRFKKKNIKSEIDKVKQHMNENQFKTNFYRKISKIYLSYVLALL